MRLLLIVASTSAFFNLYQLQALYPWLLARYGAEVPQAGWLNMASLMGMIFTAPIASKLTKNLPPQHAIIAAIGCLSLLNICIAESESIVSLAVIRILQGLVLPCVLTASMEILSQAGDENKRLRGVGYYVAGTILGSTLSRFYPAFSIDLLGWRIGFISCSALLLAACLIVMQRAKAILSHTYIRKDKKQPYFNLLKEAFLEKRLLVAYGIGFGLLFSQSSIFTVLGLYLAQPPLERTSGQIGFIYLACLPALLAVFISPKLHEMRERTVAVTLIALLWSSIALMRDSYSLIIIGVAGFAISTYLMQTLTTRMVSKARHVPVNITSGVYLSFYYAGGALGAYFSALFFHYWGWPGALTLVAIVQALLVVFVCLIIITMRREKIPYVGI